MNNRYTITDYERYRNLGKEHLSSCVDSSVLTLVLVGIGVYSLNHQPLDIVSYLTCGITGTASVVYGIDSVLEGIDSAKYYNKARKLNK